MSSKRPKASSSRSNSPSDPLHRAVSHPVVSIVYLALRSAGLLAIAFSALLVALLGWGILRRVTRVPTVLGRERVWLQYGEWKPPYGEVKLNADKYAIRSGQEYDVSLELTVPVNDNNVKLGNFMVSLSLLDGTGESALKVSRPAILIPSSSTLSFLSVPSLPTLPNPLRLLNPLSLFRSSEISSASSSCPSWSAGKGSQTLLVPLLESVSLGASLSPKKARSWRALAPPGAGKVESVWVEVGRKDAHAPKKAKEITNGELGTEPGNVRELQVFESWLRIETRLKGLRSLPHTHPYLLFSLFFPSFLFLELVAALIVYTSYVLQPSGSAAAEPNKNGESGYTTEATLKTEDEGISATVSDEDEDVKPLLSPQVGFSLTTSESETVSSETESALEEDREAAEAARARRLRLGKGGVGMSEVAGEGEDELYAAEEDAGASISDVEGELEEIVEGAVKDEEFDDAATIGGSESTRRTASTFGPSLAGTSASSATAASLSRAGLRERTIAEETEQE